MLQSIEPYEVDRLVINFTLIDLSPSESARETRAFERSTRYRNIPKNKSRRLLKMSMH